MVRLTLNAIVISITIAALSISFILPNRLWALLLIAFFLITAIAIRSNEAIYVLLFCFLLLFMPVISPIMAWWPWSLLVPLTVFHLIILCIPTIRRTYKWLKVGHISKDIVFLMLITISLSVVALILWCRFLKPDLNLYLDQMRDIPLMLITFAGLGFALLNAVMEEFAFRWIIMNGMDSAFNIPAVSIIFQAGAFGLLHYIAGFPNGIIGVLMTFVYGILLGVIRNRSKGIMAPVVTHFFADLTVFAILATIFL